MKIILNALLIALLAFSAWSGYNLYEESQKETELKYDYAEINKIKYGIFNLGIWKEKIFTIIQTKAGSFELKSSDFKSIQNEVEKYLFQLYEEFFVSGKIVEYVLEESKDEKNAVAKILMGLFKGSIEKQIEQIDFKSRIPGLASQLTRELQNKAPEIQKAISKQISNMIAAEAGQTFEDGRQIYLDKYSIENINELNSHLLEEVQALKANKKKWIQYSLLGLLGAFILMMLIQKIISFEISMLHLTLISTLFLILGLALPMIELDARLTEVDLRIMDENIHFDEQIMYYQSKSIIDVTKTLLEGHTLDLKLVGLLILLFSIILPFSKMILTTCYLFVERAKKSKFIETVIFYLGKWSMADVFVVAIFMAYIGFYGLISAQLNDMEGQTDLFTLDTINYSSLSPGIIYFTLYCLFSIFMSLLIHRRKNKMSQLENV